MAFDRPSLEDLGKQLVVETVPDDMSDEIRNIAMTMFFLGTAAMEGMMHAIGKLDAKEGLEVLHKVREEARTICTMRFVSPDKTSEAAELISLHEAMTKAASSTHH